MSEKFFLRMGGKFLDLEDQFSVRFLSQQEARQFDTEEAAALKVSELGLDPDRIKVQRSRYYWTP